MVNRGSFKERIVVKGFRLIHKLCQFGIARNKNSLISKSYTDHAIVA
jgi:hypothetical protein